MKPWAAYSLRAAVVCGGLALSGISDAAVQIGPAGELGDPNPRVTPVGANGASIARHGLGGDLERSGQRSPLHPAGGFANLYISKDGTVTASSPANSAAESDAAVIDAQLVPLPAAIWLFSSAFLGLCWLGRRSAISGVGMLPRA